jgi:hypothetical protein
MEQNKKESTEEQDQNPGSSYDVHASGSNAPTIVGDNSTFIEDHRHFQQVHVVVQQATFIQPEKGIRLL